MTVTIRGEAITAAAAALTAAWNFNPDQPRDPGGPGGGQWVAGPQTSDEEAAASGDEEAKRLFRELLNMNPDQQAKFLAGLNKDQLGRLGKFANLGSADPQIKQIRDSIGKAIEGRGMDPAQYGFKPKAAKKGAAKKGGSGKSGGSGGGGSKGKSGGSGKKSSGGSKSGGSSKKSGSSGKSSSSSSSKKTASKSADPAKSTKTEKPAKTPPPPPQVNPQPIGGPGRSRGPGGPPRVSPVRASAVPRVVIAAAEPAKPRPRITVERRET